MLSRSFLLSFSYTNIRIFAIFTYKIIVITKLKNIDVNMFLKLKKKRKNYERKLNKNTCKPNGNKQHIKKEKKKIKINTEC